MKLTISNVRGFCWEVWVEVVGVVWRWWSGGKIGALQLWRVSGKNCCRCYSSWFERGREKSIFGPFSPLVPQDFVTDDEIIAEGKKAGNVKSDSELVNDLLKYFPKPPTWNLEATESPKVREGDVSSTTTLYPAALEKSASARLAKKGSYSEDMWETFKQVKINLPLIDAIKQIPAYAKFLKDLCTQKRKLKATLPKKINLTEHVSVVLSSSLPPKFKDHGASLISVMVGNIAIKKALLDLGASINILPTSLVDKYDLGTL
nr:hypothetical protein [Tanacetum cinerariifolium]